MAEPTDPLTPSTVLLCKLGSALVHAEEMTESGFSEFDVASFVSLASDPEVVEWRAAMDRLALLPKKRSG
jgi:hypothetical protein